MTYWTTAPVTPGDLPNGYEIFRHELRGYDSPDRYYTVRFRSVTIIADTPHPSAREFGSVKDCVDFIHQHDHDRKWDNEADTRGEP